MVNSRSVASLLFIFIVLSPLTSHAGLIRAVWGCRIPCETSGHKLLKSVQISYCGAEVLSAAMIERLTPFCRDKNGRADAVAVRTAEGAVATCDATASTCKEDGPIRAGYTCKVLCPSQDNFVHKFSACATTDDEAWTNATEVCRDAVRPSSSVSAAARNCVVGGRSACQ